MSEKNANEKEELVTALKEAFVPLFERIEERFDGVDERLDKIETRLDKVETRLDKVESNVAELRGNIAATNMIIENKVYPAIQEIKIIYSGYAQETKKLRKRVEKCEDHVKENNALIFTLADLTGIALVEKIK